MKKIISSRDDIEVLVRNFYKKLLPNPVVGHYFTQVVSLDLETHFPKLIDFWESVLFGQSAYRGNPMIVHFALHDKSPFEKKHFDEWLKLWKESLDELYEGEAAEVAWTRAESIAGLMKYKMGIS